MKAEFTRRHFLGTVGALVAATGRGARTGPQKTILLKSAWDTINIGDIGHTPGTLRVFEQHLPGVHVIVWATALDDRIRAMLQRRFPRLEIVEGPTGAPAVQEAYRRADLVVHNSSMARNLNLPEESIRHGKPFGYYGQSYFPDFVVGEQGARNIAILNQAAFIFCRDGLTLEILRNAGVKPGVLEFGPDGCFGVDVRDDNRALAFMRRKGLEERKFITIQLRTQTTKIPGRDMGPRNPLNPTPEQQAEDERRAAKYRDLITRWIRRTGHKVLIAPEVAKEMGHNRRLIYDPLPRDLQAHVVNCDEFWNVDEAGSAFARAHTCICHEPHSPIIALASGTPIIHTFSEAQGTKYWMFRDLGLPEWLLEFDSTLADRMAATLMAIHDDYPGALAKVRRSMDFVREGQVDTMQVVGRILARA